MKRALLIGVCSTRVPFRRDRPGAWLERRAHARVERVVPWARTPPNTACGPMNMARFIGPPHIHGIGERSFRFGVSTHEQ